MRKWAVALSIGLILAVSPAVASAEGPAPYTVQWGDTLWSIANRFEVTLEALMRANGLANPNFIYIGQTLTIAAPSEQSSTVMEEPDIYIVGYGDTLYSIALRFETSVGALMSANGLYSPNYIWVGQRLKIDTPSSAGWGQPQPLSSASEGPSLGVHLSIWGEERAPEVVRLAREAGVTWVRQEFPWSEVEVEKGGFHWEEADRVVDSLEGFTVIATVTSSPLWARSEGGKGGPPDNYRDLGDFLFALASRYRGRIEGYQVWEEPNLASKWGQPNPAEYVALLRVACQNIKAADPEALVISAPLAPTETGLPQAIPDDLFLRKVYQLRGGRYFDLLGVNSFGFKAPPEMSPSQVEVSPFWGERRAFSFRRVEDLRRIMVENGDEEKGVAILSFGWTSDHHPGPFQWCAVSEERKADYTVRAYRWARENWRPWVEVMFAPSLADLKDFSGELKEVEL